MGMFDYLRCTYPLPRGAPLEGYQTKDTPSQWMDLYEIRADGTLWREGYDTEDRSDPNAKGLMALVGCMTKVNQRWEQLPDFTGEIGFYTGEWEFSAYFVRGTLKHLELLESPHRPVEGTLLDPARSDGGADRAGLDGAEAQPNQGAP